MKRPDVSKRMKENNPMKRSDVIEKLKKTLSNRNTFGKKNPNWRGGKIKKKCMVCYKSFDIFPSQIYIKGCSSKCSNILRKINSNKSNLGKNKTNCSWMRKISKMKKGVPRILEVKNNISKGVKKAMRKPENRERFLLGNKNRNKDFFKSKEWVKKVLSKRNSNKYIYKKINMRSNWEVYYAKWLDDNNLSWEYEPFVTRLKSIDMCYCPDFYVKEWGKFVEVKGYLSKDGERKINAFKEKFGENKLIVIREKEMKRLGLL